MKFLSVRDLRGKSAQIWKRLPEEREMVITSNGRRFHPIGHNVAWWATNANNAATIAAAFAKMGAAGENWSRVWMEHFYESKNLEWPKVGNFGMTADGKKIVSSGDLIGVRGFGIYATVDVGTETNDYLARIDPLNNWKATLMPMSTGHNRIFGLGFWGGKVYGFVAGTAANTGAMVQIDPVMGTSTDLSSGNVQWYGAAVATDAPIIQ